MHMKSAIIYYSTYRNNTEKIASLFAQKLNAELVNLKENKKINIENYDLIGFGSGIYRESMSPKLIKYVNTLDLKDKYVFVFSTSGIGLRFYNKKLLNLLKSKGAICKGSFACKGTFQSREFSDNRIFEILSRFSEGHPDEKDLYKAEKFIENLIKNFN